MRILITHLCKSSMIRHGLAIAVVCVSALAAGYAITCNINATGGTSAPPAHISQGTTYHLNVQGVPGSGERVVAVAIYSSTSSTGPWTFKGDYWGCSGTVGVQCNKTFNVANYADGSYYWRGNALGYDANNFPTGAYSGSYGPYITP